jgi:hypothetical protein
MERQKMHEEMHVRKLQTMVSALLAAVVSCPSPVSVYGLLCLPRVSRLVHSSRAPVVPLRLSWCRLLAQSRRFDRSVAQSFRFA